MADASKSVIAAKAQAIAKEASGAAGVTFDPTIIVTIITTILQLLSGCGKNAEQAEAEMNYPRALTKLMLRRECRKHCSSHDNADVLYAACLDQGAALTTGEVTAMYHEIGK